MFCDAPYQLQSHQYGIWTEPIKYILLLQIAVKDWNLILAEIKNVHTFNHN